MKHPPYHLKIQKAVDRFHLVHVMRAMGDAINGYVYVSLAGPFLEDFRLVDQYFPDLPLISLESNKQTYLRQQFHCFKTKIDLKDKPFRDYISSEYNENQLAVFWLDYTDISYARFDEFQLLLRTAATNSIVKISLNADPANRIFDALGEYASENDDLLREIKLRMSRAFADEYQSVMPLQEYDPCAKLSYHAQYIQQMLKMAASRALDTHGSVRGFMPIHCTRYNDQTPMISLTGIIHNISERGIWEERFENVRFSDFSWSEPKEIKLPELSIKERLFLEKHLPSEQSANVGQILQGQLAYRVADSKPKSEELLQQYGTYHREYPNFVRIPI